MRDATNLLISSSLLNHYFNPRVPCGTRPTTMSYTFGFIIFQSTRPMRDATILSFTVPEGKDIFQSTRPMRDATFINGNRIIVSELFQSTRPMRDATERMGINKSIVSISIHASHAGRDRNDLLIRPFLVYFNPRVPCGTRPISRTAIYGSTHFNPRVPCGTRPELEREEENAR